MGLISADRLKDFISVYWQGDKRFRIGELIRVTPSEVIHLIDEMPMVDAVEVVRCKDCKHKREHVSKDGISVNYCRLTNLIGLDNEHYCSDGERKTRE